MGNMVPMGNMGTVKDADFLKLCKLSMTTFKILTISKCTVELH